MQPDPKRLRRLNAYYRERDAEDIVADAARGLLGGRAALVSSFGAEAVVLLHLWARADPAAPVLFVDTEMLFPETIAYQRDVAARFRLTNVIRVSPDPGDRATADPDAGLHARDAEACCHLRKVAPLERAAAGYDVLLSGRKRFQSESRAALDLFEQDGAGRLKINPLAHWSRDRIAAYMDDHALPRHPLVARGYPSIGCVPCTTPVAEGEDLRAGRWRGSDRQECGIHVVDGRVARRPDRETTA